MPNEANANEKHLATEHQNATSVKSAAPATPTIPRGPAPEASAKPVATTTPISSVTAEPAVSKMQLSVTPQMQSEGISSRGGNWWSRRSTFEKEASFFVLLPTLLTFGYCALIASPMYVSEMKFAVRNAVEQPVGVDIASQLFKTASTSVQDARIVDAYLRSPDVYEKLDGELQLTKHYSDRSRDWVSRLASSPTLWDKESFWQRVAQPKIDVDSGIVTFTVRAYTPDMAQNIAVGILRQGEVLINEMNERSRNDAIRLAESEVKVAQERIVKAQKALEAFRDEHKEFDPKATATGLQSLVFELEGERSKVKAELAEARSYMKPTAPQVKALEKRLAAVETQLNAEKARIAGNPAGGGAINSWVSQYENLMIESEFAQKQLTTAMSAYEQARSMALAKSRYLVAIQQPTLPDESRYPRTWVFTLCAFFGFFLIYGLVRLIVASIREHAGF